MKYFFLIALILVGCVQVPTQQTQEEDARVLVVAHLGGGPEPCDRIYESGIDRPLPGVIVRLDDQTRITALAGLVYFRTYSTETLTLTVKYPELDGVQLLACPPDEITITPLDYEDGPSNLKFFEVVFWAYMEQEISYATITSQ